MVCICFYMFFKCFLMFLCGFYIGFMGFRRLENDVCVFCVSVCVLLFVF